MKKEALCTPNIVLDLKQLESNIKEMADQVAKGGVQVRPHIKTHKTIEIANMQMKYGAVGITAARLEEAEVMMGAGFDDIFIANELVGVDKIRRLARLAKRIKVRTCVDSFALATMLSEAAQACHVTFEVLLDVNTGLNRTGVSPEEAVQLGTQINALPGIRLSGVFSFAGYKPGIPDQAVRKRWAEQEAGIAVSVCAQLREKGVGAAIVSVAGTSSAVYASKVPGVTEVRPGTYVFNDLNYTRMGIAPLSSCALRIRASIISRPSTDRAVIDAGSKVLTTEKKVNGADDPGYGYIVQCPGTKIAALWEEHGVLHLDEDGKQLSVGDMIDIIPNHVCPTVNLQHVMYGLNGDRVESVFTVAAKPGAVGVDAK